MNTPEVTMPRTGAGQGPGPADDPVASEDLRRIVEKHRGKRGDLIAILTDVQAKYHYLPENALRTVAEETGRSLVDVYGTATFYKHFSLKPRGKHLVSVCLGTACHVRGGAAIAAEFERRLKIRAGGTTADREFTLETVNCLGACALGPIVVVDGRYFSNVTNAKVLEIIGSVRAGLSAPVDSGEGRDFPVKVSCARCNHSLLDGKHPIDGHPSVHLTVSHGSHHGWIRISSVYGRHTMESKHEIPTDAEVNFFCPHCHAELVSAGSCPECGAHMVPMIVQGGGIVQICARRGCAGHRLDLSGDGM